MYLNETAYLLLEGIIKDALKTQFFDNEEGKKKIAKNFNQALKDFTSTNDLYQKLNDIDVKINLNHGNWNVNQANNYLRSKFNFVDNVKTVARNLDTLNILDKTKNFEKFVKDKYGDEFKHYDAPEHKKIEVIKQLPNYWDRDLVLARADDKLIPFYRSTGMNGHKNAWFPFAGILAPYHPLANYYKNMDDGWIIKNALAIDKNKVHTDITLGSFFRPRDKNYRLIPFGNFPINLKQVSDYLEKQNIPVSSKKEDNYNLINKELFDLFKIAKKL